MMPLRPPGPSWPGLLLLSALLAAYAHTAQPAEPRVVCYYTNWSVYRPGNAKFSPQNINPYLCTHLIYSFGGFTKDNALKPFDKYQDIEKGGYAKFTGLKTYNKNLKCMLAIGGWNEGSGRFSPLVASAERRQQFTKNAIKFLRQNHFDGLDLDWEYPAHRDGGKPRDRDNYAQFVQELREEFERESSKTGKPRLLLTMAVPAGVETVKKGYDVRRLNKYLDWFNLLTYDYHSSFEPSVNHHAPLMALEEDDEYNYDAELNIDYSIKYYLNEGADREKLVLGIPTYGRSYTLLNEESTDIGAPTDGPGDQGDATREKGYLAYYEICQSLKEEEGWTVVQPNPKAMGPYAFRGNQWVGYDDEQIVRRKGEYVVANGLGGIMFWAIDNDDFRGTCTGKAYPLIEAAKDAMLSGLGLGDNDVVAPVAGPHKKPPRSRSRQGTTSVNRVETGSKDKEVAKRPATRRPATRRKPASTTESSLYAETSARAAASRTTTPAPPTTPDPGGDFKCEDEGFFSHPRDCTKYFWCLDSGASNLGIVANPFSCPTGLVFNKHSESCDYPRNVECTTKTKAPKPIEVTTPLPSTTAAPTSARPSRIITTRKSTTSTTTELPEEEYDDEEEELPQQFHETLDEEDPKVIKELIDLIKRVGGIEKLERHLSIDGTTSTNVSGEKTDAQPLISKTLYNKVLNSASGRSFMPRNRYTFSTNRTGTVSSSSGSSSVTEGSAVLVQSAVSGNKYSSVIRNSRPSAQSDGIDRVAAVQQKSTAEAKVGGRPQYVTIQRPSTKPREESDEEDDAADEEDDAEEVVADDDEEDEDEDTDTRVSNKRTSTTTTSHTQYVNIQRNRGSTTVKPTDAEDEDEEEEEEVPQHKKYSTLERRRNPAQLQASEEKTESEEKKSSVGAISYNTIDRHRTADRQSGVSVVAADPETTVPQSNLANLTDNNDTPTTTTTNTTTTITTREYSSVARRTTTTTTDTPTILSTTSTPTTTTAPITDTTLTAASDDDELSVGATTSASVVEIDDSVSATAVSGGSVDIDLDTDLRPLTTTEQPVDIVSSTERRRRPSTTTGSSSTSAESAATSAPSSSTVGIISSNTFSDSTLSVKDTTNITQTGADSSAPAGDAFLASVSSPRPFSIAKRTRRPFGGPKVSSSTTSETLTADVEGSVEAGVNKVSSTSTTVLLSASGNKKHALGSLLSVRSHALGAQRVESGQNLQQEQQEQSAQSLGTVDEVSTKVVTNRTTTYSSIRGVKPIRRTRPSLNRLQTTETSAEVSDADVVVQSQPSPPERKTYASRPNRFQTTEASAEVSEHDRDVVEPKPQRPSFVATRPNRFRLQDARVSTTSTESGDAAALGEEQPLPTTRVVPRRRFRPRFDAETFGQNEFGGGGYETTTKFVERLLRPDIGNDLSSLTAVDFGRSSGDTSRAPSRRIWPNRTRGPSSSTTPIVYDEVVQDRGESRPTRPVLRTTTPIPRVSENEDAPVTARTRRPIGTRRLSTSAATSTTTTTTAPEPEVVSTSTVASTATSKLSALFANRPKPFQFGRTSTESSAEIQLEEEDEATTVINDSLVASAHRNYNHLEGNVNVVVDNTFETVRTDGKPLRRKFTDSPIFFLKSGRTTTSPLLGPLLVFNTLSKEVDDSVNENEVLTVVTEQVEDIEVNTQNAVVETEIPTERSESAEDVTHTVAPELFNESEEEVTATVAPRVAIRHPSFRITTLPPSVSSEESETETEQPNIVTQPQSTTVTTARTPFRRPSFRTTASPSDIPSEAPIVVVTRGRRPLIRSTTTTVPTTSEISGESENVRTSVRQRPSFRLSTGSRTTTTSSEIVDETHVEEHNDVSVVAVNQVRQRPAFNRRPFATRTTPKSGEEEQNGESQVDIDETNVEEHNEVSVVAVNQVRQRPAFNRRPFATRTTPKSDEEDQNSESQTDVDETHVEEHNEVSVITRNTVRQRPAFNRRPIGTRTTPKSSEEDLNSELQATVDETLVEEHNDESIVTRNQVRQRPALIRRPFTTRTTPKSDEDIHTESQAAVDETLVEEQNDVSVLTKNQVRQRPAFNRRPFNTRTTPKSDDEELNSESQTDIAETHEEEHNEVSVITRNQVRQRPAFNPRPLRTRTTPKSEEVESVTDSVDINEVNEVNEVHEVRQRPTFNRRPTLEAAEPVDIEAKTTISELSRSRFNSKRFKPETFVTTEGALTSEINEKSTSTLTSRAPIEVTSTESVDAADETTVEAETEIPATEKPKRRRKVIRRRRPVATVDENIASDSSAVIKSDVELTLSTELPTVSSNPTFRPLLRRTTTENPEESTSLSSVDPAEYSSTTEVSLEDASTLSSVEPLESSTTFTRSPIRTILRRTSTTTETPLSDEPATYNDQPNTTNIEVLPVRGYFRPAASAVATDESSTSAESSTLRHAKGFSPSSNAFQRKRPQSIQEHIATDSTEVEDEHEENNNIEHKDAGSDRVAVTPSTTTTRPVFTRAGSRVPFRPTRPTSSVTATTASSVDATSARTFVRKFSSKFQLSSRPEVQDNVDGDLIGRVKPFGLPVQRPSSVSHFRNTFKQLDDGNDGDYDDEEYVNSAEQFNEDDEEDEDHDSEEDSRPVLRPSFPGASKRPTYNNRFNLNREEPALVAPKIRPSLLAATAQSETEDADDEPIVHTQPQYNRFQPPVQATKRPAVAVNRPKFGAAPARKQNVPYAARRPTTPASRVDAEAANALLADLDRNALNSRNKAIFEKNNKKHYSNTPLTNPYNISSNNTNNNNNTTSTPSTSTDQQHNLPSISTSSTNEHLHHQFTTESYTNTFMTTTDTDDDDATASTQSLGQLLVETLFGGDEADDQTNAIILNEFQNGDEEAASFSTVSATESAAGAETTTNSAVDTTSTYTNTFRPRAERPTTTTTQKPTTLHHIFAVDYDDQTEATATAASTSTVDPATVATTTYIPDVAVTATVDTVEPPAELITHKLEKLAEVSRIVEISSQQQTQHSNEMRSPASDVIIEKKPTLETLGEISRLTLIKLVERQIDTVRGERRDHRQLVLPEQIFSVETSTIPLEALFDRDRAAKQLSLDEAILGTVATGTTTTSTAALVATTVATSAPDSGDVVTTTETSQQVHSLAPQLRPESNESIPLVISIANLDQVILSKKPTDGNGNGGDDDVAHQVSVPAT